MGERGKEEKEIMPVNPLKRNDSIMSAPAEKNGKKGRGGRGRGALDVVVHLFKGNINLSSFL